MDLTSLVVTLVIGALAGWSAGQLLKGRGFGLAGNVVVGIAGALIGGWLFAAVGVPLAAGLLGALIRAIVGALLLLFIIGLVKKI